MRRTVCLLAGVLLVVLGTGADAPLGYDGTAERDELQGEWHLVAVRFNGEESAFAGVGIVFRAGNFGGILPSERTLGTYRADTGRTPAHLDLTKTSDGWTRACIYRVDGDTLWVANENSYKNRPKGFDGKDVVLCIYRRVKK
jgi:uncharacterized protein (TIGR03067 family)